MKYTDIQMGTKLELEIFDDMGEKVFPNFISEMEWVEEDNIAFIAAPIHEGNIYPVRRGSVMNVIFNHKDDLFKFKAEVIARGIKDNIALLKIQIQSDLEKIQRRQYFRFECKVPIKYRVLKTLKAEDKEKKTFITAFTRDISGGGLSISSEEKIEMDKFIECELELDNGRVLRFIGKIVKSVKDRIDPMNRYEAGVFYKKISYSDREVIIGYIFREQRKLRKKGLI